MVGRSERPVRLLPARSTGGPAGSVTRAGFGTGGRSNERRLGRRRMDGRTGHGRIGRTTKCVGKQSNSRGVGGRREGKRERGGVFGENIRRPRLRRLRRLWRRRLFCIHFVRHLHCRQTEQPRSGRGRAASLPPSLGVLGVNSSSPSSTPVTSASTAALRRRRRRVGRRPKVWSPENLKRRTGAAAAAAAALIFAFLWPESACVRAAADHQLLSPSFLPSFGLSQACAGGRPETTNFFRPLP